MTNDRRATANKGFAIAGLTCFVDTFVQDGSSILSPLGVGYAYIAQDGSIWLRFTAKSVFLQE